MAQAASIIPVCSDNKFLNRCAKNRLSFPLFKKNKNGDVVFKYKTDQGGLGEFSSEEASQFTEDVLKLWSDESEISFEKLDGGLLDVDIDEANLDDYIDKGQGFNLIIWDETGDIVSELYGKRSKKFLLGYASPIFFNFKNTKINSIDEAQSLLNGFLFDRKNSVVKETRAELEALFKSTILHEFAHMFGIDHTQGGNLEGFNNNEGDFTDIPIMFPFAANPNIALHQDDIAAIKLAYPKATDLTDLASISGKLTKSGIALKGANVVAYKLSEDNPKLLAIASPSDVDGLGQGNYLIPNLIPGDYVLYAEPIDKDFVDGSSIGFHETPANFSSGFYNGAASFLELGFNKGISRAQVITLNPGDRLENINIDTDGRPNANSNTDSNGEASFISGGKLINGEAIRLLNKKAKRSKIKIVNLNPGTKLNIQISTNYPDLIKFKNSGTYKFKKRSKKIKVKLASYLDFIKNTDFEDLADQNPVSVAVTIKDLDSGYIETKDLIIK